MTVVDAVTPEMLLFRDELRTRRAGHDLGQRRGDRVSQRQPLGLQAAVFTSLLSRARRYIDRLRTSTAVVNGTVCFRETHPPFGGAARSKKGWGHIGGEFTMLDMNNLRTTVIDVDNTRDGC